MATETSIPLYEAMSTLRAVRRLRPSPIPDDVLHRLLQAAAWAPSGGNVQPWRVVVVTDTERRRELGKLYRRQWTRFGAAYRSGLEALDGDERARAERTLGAGDFLGDHFGEAPVIIVFCFSPGQMAITDADLSRPSVVGGASVYPAIENLMLACVSEGVGCTLTTLLCLEEAAVKTLLEIPDDWYTCAAIPLGYPRGKGHGPIRRKTPEQLAYANTFGASLPEPEGSFTGASA